MLHKASIPPHLEDIQIPAVQFIDPRGNEHHAIWCPWCEGLHLHGQSAGRRAAGEHCHPHRGSPLNGYVLKPVSKAGSENDAIPRSPFAGKKRLTNALLQKQISLIGAVTKALTGLRKEPNGIAGRGMPGAQSWVRRDTGIGPNAANWTVHKYNEGRRDGNNLIELAAFLYGVTPGVAAVRILEATTGACLNADTALAVSHAVDQWHARGSPRGERRRI